MKRYLQYLLQKNKKLFIMSTILFFIVHPLFAFTISMYYENLSAMISETLDYRLLSMVSIIVLAAYSLVMPIVISLKSMSLSGADQIYALAITKEKRLLSEILYSWIVIFVPFIISCLLMCFVLWNRSIDSLLPSISIFIYAIVIISAWYLFNVLLCRKCYSIKDAIIVEGLYLIAFFALGGIVDQFFTINSINQYTASLLINEVGKVLSLFSPIRALISVYYSDYALYVGVVYVIYCAMLLYFIQKAEKYRKVENSGGLSESKMLYPFVLNALVILYLITSMNDRFSFDVQLRMYITLFVAYLGVNFIAIRKFKLTFKPLILFVLCIGLSFVIRYAYTESNHFAFAYAYRNMEDVKKVDIVIGDYFKEDTPYQLSLKNDRNTKDSVLEIQDYLVAKFKEKGKEHGSFAYINFIYYTSGTEKFIDYSLDKTDLEKVFNILEKHEIDYESQHREN